MASASTHCVDPRRSHLEPHDLGAARFDTRPRVTVSGRRILSAASLAERAPSPRSAIVRALVDGVLPSLSVEPTTRIIALARTTAAPLGVVPPCCVGAACVRSSSRVRLGTVKIIWVAAPDRLRCESGRISRAYRIVYGYCSAPCPGFPGEDVRHRCRPAHDRTRSDARHDHAQRRREAPGSRRTSPGPRGHSSTTTWWSAGRGSGPAPTGPEARPGTGGTGCRRATRRGWCAPPAPITSFAIPPSAPPRPPRTRRDLGAAGRVGEPAGARTAAPASDRACPPRNRRQVRLRRACVGDRATAIVRRDRT